MQTEVMRYYQNIFTTSAVGGDVIRRVQSRITDEMNARLLRPVEMEEVKSAVFSMMPDKAPGPDGMNPSFYQNFWSVVGRDLIDFVTHCIDTRYM